MLVSRNWCQRCSLPLAKRWCFVPAILAAQHVYDPPSRLSKSAAWHGCLLKTPQRSLQRLAAIIFVALTANVKLVHGSLYWRTNTRVSQSRVLSFKAAVSDLAYNKVPALDVLLAMIGFYTLI